MFRKKIRISLLDEKWEILIPLLKVDVVPRIGEYMWWPEQDSYYKVINVVHNIANSKIGVFVVLEKISINGEKKLENT